MLFELFRNINATIGIYITLIYLYKNKHVSISFINKYSKIFLMVMSIYLILLINEIFRFKVMMIKIIQTTITVYFSKSKKIKLSIKNYYDELSNYMCVK